MKTSTWVIIGVLAVGAWWYLTNLGGGLTWLIQNLSIQVNGLLTQVQIQFVVTNSGTSSVALTNTAVNIIYNGSTIGSGIVNTTILPGTNNVTATVNLSDLSIIADIATAAENGTGSIAITVQETGKANNLPFTLTQGYTF
jgi:archaellum component FlaG (FlaF/FlaG flagellin family)